MLAHFNTWCIKDIRKNKSGPEERRGKKTKALKIIALEIFGLFRPRYNILVSYCPWYFYSMVKHCCCEICNFPYKMENKFHYFSPSSTSRWSFPPQTLSEVRTRLSIQTESSRSGCRAPLAHWLRKSKTKKDMMPTQKWMKISHYYHKMFVGQQLFLQHILSTHLGICLCDILKGIHIITEKILNRDRSQSMLPWKRNCKIYSMILMIHENGIRGRSPRLGANAPN